MIHLEMRISGDEIETECVLTSSIPAMDGPNPPAIVSQLGRRLAQVATAAIWASKGKEFGPGWIEEECLEPDGFAEVLRHLLFSVEHFNEKGYPIPLDHKH